MAFKIYPSSTLVMSDFAAGGLFQGRLERVDDDTAGLLPVNGNRVVVPTAAGGVAVGSLPNLGLQQAIASRTIDAAGADTGGNMAASTYYNVYLGAPDVAFSPNSLRASLVAPTKGTDGIYRLGAVGSGNAAGWLWVGGLFVSAAGTLLDVNQQRHVASVYNSRLQRVHSAINWTNTGAATVYTLGSATWAPIAGSGVVGGADTLSWIDLAIDDFVVELQVNVSSTTALEWTLGIGADQGGNYAVGGAAQSGPIVAGVGGNASVSIVLRAAGAPGQRTLVAVGRSDLAVAVRFLGNMPRNGAPQDPVGSFFSALGRW